jgi:hypothetical protein
MVENLFLNKKFVTLRLKGTDACSRATQNFFQNVIAGSNTGSLFLWSLKR